MTYKTVIFDFDGTLLDTKSLEQHFHLFKNTQKFTKEHTEGRKQFLTHVKECREYEGMRETLDFIKSNGYDIYIVTGGSKDKVLTFIKDFNLRDVFDPKHIISCYAKGRFNGRIYKRGGNPTLFNICLEKFNLDPSTCIAFGNEVCDKLAANNANITAYNCLWGADADEAADMKLNYKDSTIESPRDIINLLN